MKLILDKVKHLGMSNVHAVTARASSSVEEERLIL